MHKYLYFLIYLSSQSKGKAMNRNNRLNIILIGLKKLCILKYYITQKNTECCIIIFYLV